MGKPPPTFIKSGTKFVLFIIFPTSIKSDGNNLLINALNYLNTINEFSSPFLQIQNNDVSEGLIYIKKDRIRIEYVSPSNLIFVLKENKGMYFNVDLQEVEYFNPKNTIGKFIIDLFYNDSFLLDSEIKTGKGHFYIFKKFQLEEKIYKIKIYFEENPLQLRKIEIVSDLEIFTFSILSPNYNPELSDKIFSLANPLLS